jgi:hypothetical protein
MTISQIRTAVKQEVKVPSKDRFAAEIREGLSGQAGIYIWPEFKRSPLFASQPLAACVKEALLRALDEEPLTVTNAAQTVKKALKHVSEKQVVKEIKVLLMQQTASGTIIRLPVGRQAGIYLSRNWMAKHAQAEGGEGSLRAVIPEVIARMQSGPGNYVRVDHIRIAPEILAIFDKAVMELARAGKLVLGRYEGPRPIPEVDYHAYIHHRIPENLRGPGPHSERDKEDLFIGVALPRNQEA